MRRPTTVLARDQIDSAVLGPAVDQLIAELHLPEDFPADVLADAQSQATDPDTSGHVDRTDLAFVTIDPPGSTDLDQAMCLQRNGSGYRVYYAIADVPAFVRFGSAVDGETRRRGQTMYAPTKRIPLHPPVLSEDAASLLPDQVRPAFLWTIDLDDAGATTAATVERAMVRSRAQLTYEQVQADHDAGTPGGSVALLATIGPLLQQRERARGGAALAIPDQEVVPDPDHPGKYQLRYRPNLPVEDWNAQISLLTGMSAATMMLNAKIGILRTLPPPDEATKAKFRRRADALGVHWPQEQPYGEFLHSLDPTDPKHLALLHASARLFRGAGYTPFDGEVPEHPEQAAVAAPYAHVTAPLRRLVDRFGLLICASVSAGQPVPDEVRQALPELPKIMADSDHQAGALDRACIDLAEALLMTGREGESFQGVVVDVPDGSAGKPRPASVQLVDPAVLASVTGDVQLGDQITIRLEHADVVKRTVQFVVV